MAESDSETKIFQWKKNFCWTKFSLSGSKIGNKRLRFAWKKSFEIRRHNRFWRIDFSYKWEKFIRIFDRKRSRFRRVFFVSFGFCPRDLDGILFFKEFQDGILFFKQFQLVFRGEKFEKGFVCFSVQPSNKSRRKTWNCFKSKYSFRGKIQKFRLHNKKYQHCWCNYLSHQTAEGWASISRTSNWRRTKLQRLFAFSRTLLNLLSDLNFIVVVKRLL